MRTRYFSYTDTGRRRRSNEDAFLCDVRLALFVVCDGVGGASGGHTASMTAVELIGDRVRSNEQDLRASAHPGEPGAGAEDRVGMLVREAVEYAAKEIYSVGQTVDGCRGMSTTASVVLAVNGRIVVGHVGDSRVYLAHDGKVIQLTEDHTWMNLQVRLGRRTPEEARRQRAAGKNMITRALGFRESVEVDIFTAPVCAGDKLLLCSDGLHTYLDSTDSLTSLFQLDIKAAAHAAVRHANDRGGADNITATFVEFLAS